MPVAVPTELMRQVMREHNLAVGQKIKERRLFLGMGPTVFAGILGVPLQTLHKIETGQMVPRDHLKAALALALGVELADLYPWPTNADLVDRVERLAQQGRAA